MSKQDKEKFNPENHTIMLDDGTVYLPVAWRKAWFLDEHSEGRIITKLEFMKDINGFIATAEIFLKRDDDMPATIDYGFRFVTKDGQGDQNAPMEAITQAIGRALANVGYGTQFCGTDEGSGLTVIADAPTTLNNSQNQEGKGEGKGKRGRKPTKDKIVEETQNTEENVKNETAGTEEVKETIPKKEVVNTTNNTDVPKTVEEAKKVLITFGQKKGQFMGEVFAIDPGAVKWYAEKYIGSNEAVKAAAKLLCAK